MIAVDACIMVIIVVMVAYSIRHYRFSWNRMFSKQKRTYKDLNGAYTPSVSVLVPAHNEEKVLHSVVDRLIECDYPKENGKFEVIIINDRSEDRTGIIADTYAAKHSFIKVVHRSKNGGQGKPEALNVALPFASNEIVLFFDADYQPPKDCIKQLVAPFYDIEIGGVMGRVVPINSPQTALTRLMDIERSGGYQVDQQARYNLDLIPQFGGTVGGFKRDVLKAVGGWDPNMLTEDTDITYKVFLQGWKIAYVNLAECYEEVVDSWDKREKQLRRWAIGHNQCLFKHFFNTLKTPVLNMWQKIDGILLLGVYLVPVFVLAGWILGIVSYLFDAPWWSPFFLALLFFLSYNSIGNFAVFNEMGNSAFLDKRGRSIWLLPMVFFTFFANMIICSTAFVDAVLLEFENKRNKGNGIENAHYKKQLTNEKNNRRKRWEKTGRYGNGMSYYNNMKNNRTNGTNGQNGATTGKNHSEEKREEQEQ
ncbi:MAG: glycosyltransferase [archaeon]